MSDSHPQIEAHTRLLSTELIEAAEKGVGPWMLVMSERMARVEAKQDYGILRIDQHEDRDEERFTAIGQQINIAVNSAGEVKNEQLKDASEKKARNKLIVFGATFIAWCITTGMALWALTRPPK